MSFYQDPRLYTPQHQIASASAKSREREALQQAIKDEQDARRRNEEPAPAAKGAKLVGKGGAKTVEGRNGGIVDAGSGSIGGNWRTFDVAIDGEPAQVTLLTQ